MGRVMKNRLHLTRPVCGAARSANRDQRIKSQAYLTRKAELMTAVGGEAAYLADLEDRNKWAWAYNMPGPHHKMGVMEAFDRYSESGNHGDRNHLIKDWAEQIGLKSGSGGNVVVPFATFGWGEKLQPAFWVLINHPVRPENDAPTAHVQLFRIHAACAFTTGGT